MDEKSILYDLQLLMGVFQLGSLSVFLSAELISGFTSGCAIHVLTSQMKNLLGLKGRRRTGIFKIPLVCQSCLCNKNSVDDDMMEHCVRKCVCVCHVRELA